MAAVKINSNDNLQRIKHNVATSFTYFQDNYKRFRKFREYVFRESISEQQRAVLTQLNRPIIECNILEAYISRLLGEFAKHEPSIEVSPSEGVPVGQDVLDLVEGHIRHIFHEADKNSFSYNIYKDLLSGGYSVAKVWTDYSTPMSFNQQIFLKRVFDPTLVGFDPMARDSHKADASYCFEMYPMLEDDFKRTFPNADVSTISFTRDDIEGFNWSYKDNSSQKIVLVADYYEKKKRKVKIVKLANGRSMTLKNYEKLQAYWEENQFIEQIPEIVNTRMTELETICCYKFNEHEILKYEETDYTYLPYIFMDGNSIDLVQGTSNCTYQMTRPYVYHAKGIQDLTNFSANTIANSMENLIQHKFIVMKEAIPQEEDYLEALNDIQRANTIVVNAYSENNPDKPIPTPIREVQNVPLPPEVMATFQLTAPMTQTILGSFASNLGKNDNDLSGKAVIESSTVGNAAAMPYIVGYLQGLTQIGNVIVDLMPKYLVGPRTIPTKDLAGNREYQKINASGYPMINYDEKAIRVNIDAGVNFQVQKTQAMEQIVALMQASPEFAAFMNDDESLPILLDNLTIYGADRIQEAVPKWIEKKNKIQQEAMQAQQQAMQNDPRMIKAQADIMKAKIEQQSLDQKEAQQQVENQISMAQLQIDKELATAKLMEAESKISNSQIEMAVKMEESETSRFNHEIDAAAKMAEVQSREHEQRMNEHAAGLAEKKLEHEMKRSKEDAKIQSND